MKKWLVFVVIAVLAIGGFYLVKNTQRKPLVDYVVNTPNPADYPTIASPISNSKVTSPLKILGTVPPGWMFEGTFPIKLVDQYQNVIAIGQGKEVTPGSWQSGQRVDFVGEIEFKTSEKTGSLVFFKDNPSGLQENDRSYSVPVKF